MDDAILQLKEKFYELFGKEKEEQSGKVGVYFAPGRVNLIGEHTDYNGGHVFPCALTIGTYGVIRPRRDRRFKFFSLNFPQDGMVSVELDNLVPDEAHGWANYPKGVAWTLQKKGYELPFGADILIYGDIPAGSGLSSSASLEVLTGCMLGDLYGLDMSPQELALVGQYAENHFNGMNCGIMDQFASAMGRKNCAIFLDTATLQYEYAPIDLKDAKIVITNSKVKHSLVTSAYNERRRECEFALEQLQTVVDIRTLGDLTPEEFEQYQDAITDEVRRKRARHAVYENHRTIQAVKALQQQDVESFGRLMNEAHVSMRDDYEASCLETDILAELAWELPGVIGSRITGGGFGGCTVSIVKDDAIEQFKGKVYDGYLERTGNKAEFYVVQIGDGVHKIE